MAASIYVILSDGLGRSRAKSILSQLGLKGMAFKSSARKPFLSHAAEEIVMGDPPLIMCAFGTTLEPTYIPLSKMPYDMIFENKTFSEWWEQVIFKNSHGLSLTRKNLIMSMRNQDNGAHFDEAISVPAYLELAESAHGTMFFGRGGNGSDPETMDLRPPPSNAHLATVRQIAFEVEASLFAYFNDVPPVAPSP
ncbi:hypothetical protein [Novosphingobium soli]|uniref:Uncharacterized protein n=1 Tax=Novosphingobium soli TaxID=574956 RepID=A0ABV6CX15_9SPHN